MSFILLVLNLIEGGCDNAIIEQSGNQGNNKQNRIIDSHNSLIQTISSTYQSNLSQNIQLNLNFKPSPTLPLIQYSQSSRWFRNYNVVNGEDRLHKWTEITYATCNGGGTYTQTTTGEHTSVTSI